MTTQDIARARRKQRVVRATTLSSASGWPINEILLESLEARGLSDIEIARRFQVNWRQVAALREEIR